MSADDSGRMILWGFSRRLSWRGAALAFGGAGLVMVVLAAQLAYHLRTMLATRARVEARVDSADVVSGLRTHGVGRFRRDQDVVYAARVWLTYQTDGNTYAGPLVEGDSSRFYDRAMHDATEAVRLKGMMVMVDQKNPRAVVRLPGSTWSFFGGPLVLGGFGVLFVVWGAVYLRSGLGRGLDRLAGDPDVYRMSVARGAILAGMCGILLVLTAGVLAHVENDMTAAWIPVQARVDSADVVSKSDHTYAVRKWLSYEIGGRAYRVPRIASLWRDDSGAAVRAAAAARGEIAPTLVDPSDRYNVSPMTTAATRVWLPIIILGLGLICLAGAAIVWRRRARDHASRARRATSAHGTATAASRKPTRPGD